jgi:hypothetical protein
MEYCKIGTLSSMIENLWKYEEALPEEVIVNLFHSFILFYRIVLNE